MAQGEYLFILDSDDYLVLNALERIDFWIKTISGDNQFVGVSGLKMQPDGKIVGDKWSNINDYIDCTSFDKSKYKLNGDKAEAWRTDILKKFYPIPEFENENAVQKGVLWNRIANAGYLIRWFNESIYVCEYLDDGMTQNANKKF